MATYPAIESHPMSALNADRILLAEELLEAAERAQNFTSASGAVIALRRGNDLIVRTSSGVAPEVGICFGLDDNLLGTCIRTGKPRECNSDASEATRHPALAPLGIRSVAAVPISCDGSACAVLAVFSQMPAAFSRTHVAILMTLRDVIGSKLQRAAVPLESWAETPPPPAVVAQSKPQTEPAVAEVEAADKPAQPVVAPPPPTTNAAELLRLVETPPPPPIEQAPGLLGPGEDPGRFRPQPVVMAPPRPVAILTRPVAVTPMPSPKMAMAETPTPTLRSYAEAAESHKRLNIKLLAGVAGLLVLAAGLGMYWGTRERPDVNTRPTTVAEAQPAAVNPAPITMTVEAPAKPAAPPKVTEISRPTTVEKSAAPEKPAASQKEKPVTPTLQLAPAVPKPKLEVEPAGEAPALTAAATNAGLPELPTPKAPAAALAARQSVVAPATLAESKPPLYPELARRMGVQGSVKMQVSIAADGSIAGVRVLSGDPMLRQASINAVRQWRYRPATLDGHPVESTAEVSLLFKAPK